MSKRPVSIRDVAREAGVSIASVSRVINEGSGSVSAETKTKVLETVRRLGYRPNRAGRALRSQMNDTYALIISNTQNNFYAAVAWEIERFLVDQGKAMLIFNSNEDPDVQDSFLDEIVSRQTSGVFFLCAVDSPRLRTINSTLPSVLVNRRVNGIKGIPFVGIDDYAAARELTASVMQHPGRSIGFLPGPAWSDTSAQRLRGMCDAFNDAGQAVLDEDISPALLSMESGYTAAVTLLDGKHYDALICGNDQIAYGAYRRCRELGLAVPKDVTIHGFDDNPINEWLAPWLNTVRVPHQKMAKAAMTQMMAQLAGGTGTDQILPYELVMKS